MAMCNIPSTNNDPSYRYKMPKIVSQKEGGGNGSKTRVVNMGDVARALRRPPQYTTKWFGYELGAKNTYTNKKGEGELAIVNGHLDTPIFQTMLDKFIQAYVLCPNCQLPETDMNVKNDRIVSKCAACGWAGLLDENHKLGKFIIRNPPDESGLGLSDAASGGDKKSKKDKRADREAKRKEKEEQGKVDGDEEEDHDDDVDSPEKKKKKEKKDKSEKKDNNEKKEKAGEIVEGEGKKQKKDKKEKKEPRDNQTKDEKKQKNKKIEKVSEGHSGEDHESESSDKKDNDSLDYDSAEIKNVISSLQEFVESKGGMTKTADFFDELRMQQLSQLFDEKVRLYVALEVLMKNGAMDAKALAEHTETISKCVNTKKMSGSDVLCSFGAYLDINRKALKRYPMVLKVIYEEDWASEEDILAYYGESSSNDPGFDKAKKSAQPFLNWLQTEEESDDDDEDSSDDN